MIIDAINSCHNQYRANFRHNKHTYSETLQIRKELDKKVADLDDLGTLFMLFSLPFIFPAIEEYPSKTSKIGGLLVILSAICIVAASVKKFKLYKNGEYKGGKNDPQNSSTK